jgi:hypothetical protein
MNQRVLLSGFLVLVCLATLWGVWSQQNQLARLRAEQQQVLAQVAAKTERSVSPGTPDTGDASSVAPPPTLVVTPELLRLRGEVTRLTERRRELAGVRAENERLRAQLASQGTNGPAGIQLPSAYVRRSEARMMGYNTPDDTLQSLLWAIQNHDLTNFFQAFTPEIAEKGRATVGESPQVIEDLFTQVEGFVGIRILKREPDAYDNSIVVEMEVVPGDPVKRTTFSPVNGQWKISGGF